MALEVGSSLAVGSSQHNAVIEFGDALKNYGSNKRIGPVNLRIAEGEVVGFLGPNGSGKTTCIRMILGLIRPSSGSVRVNGFDPISRHTDALRDVAYSPELPNIQTFLTPRELLDMILHELSFPSSPSSRKEETKRVLELVGLSEYAETKVGKLSKGMVQRLSVAQALVGSPKTLILDEPMIGLDPAGSAHFREVFREFASETNRGTVFMSSHIMSEVESLCTSVAIIHNGRILFQGKVREVIQNALNYSVVHLDAEGLTLPTIQRIWEIPGVAQVTPKKSGSNTYDSLEILVRNQDDVRPAISELIVKSGAKLYSIKQADNMLERAYMEALKKDGGGTR